MFKEFEKEAIEVIKKIYGNISSASMLYLIRKRVLGGKDFGLESAIKEIKRGLLDNQYHFYKNPKTPLLLFEKNLLIKKDTLTLKANRFKQIHIKTPLEPIGFLVIPNYDLIYEFEDNIENYILDKTEEKRNKLNAIIESQHLRILSNGTSQLKYEDKWLTFCEINLKQNEKGVITSNSGKLLYYLVKRKKNSESASNFSINSITEELEFSEKEMQNTIDTLKSSIRKKLQETKGEEKVRIYRERNNKTLVFINLAQNKDQIQQTRPL
jgi:hypothetical protein